MLFWRFFAWLASFISPQYSESVAAERGTEPPKRLRKRK